MTALPKRIDKPGFWRRHYLIDHGPVRCLGKVRRQRALDFIGHLRDTFLNNI
jgi:hypothetical protein